jgi:HK97 family phage major capsid protein/HK97 family phage prohead protease
MSDEIKVGRLLRDCGGVELKIEKRDAATTRLQFSASSESPVERFFGTEVLSHDRKAIRMERFARGAAPLLFNHNADDPIGMITDARVEKGRLLVDAEMFATERAREVEAMMNGGLRNVSIGYQIHALDEEKKGIYRATDWEPMEVSIVTVPADSSVGIGRSQVHEVPVRITRAAEFDQQAEQQAIRESVRAGFQPAAPAASQERGISMSEQQTPAAGAQAATQFVQVTENGFDPARAEAERISTIRKLAASNDITDERQVMHWVRSGKSWDQIADDILKVREERSKASPAVLGLTPSEKSRFSVVRAINAALTRDWSKAGFEAEVSRAAAQRAGVSLNEFTFIMPHDVLTREMIVGTASSGGYLVGTDIQPQSFIDILRNRSVAMQLGAKTLSGLNGSVTIPTMAASGAVGWLLESGTATENNLTVGQKTLSPKTVGGYQQYSRQLLIQSSMDVENLINNDLAALIALKVDAAVLAGTSTDSSVPLGIRYTSGLGTANPTAGTAVAYGDMIKLQSTVAASNALFDGFSYVCHPAIAAVLMGKPRFTNSDTPIWEGALLDGSVVGKRAMSSLQITSGTMLGGDFGQVYVGEFGPGVQIEANPYANFQAGIVGIRAFYSVDVLVRYGAAFAFGTGITG